jgi:hypothetical protein
MRKSEAVSGREGGATRPLRWAIPAADRHLGLNAVWVSVWERN